MSTTDELLEEMLEDAEEYATPVTDDDLQFWINEHLRVISIPKNGVVAGVEGDKNVNKIKFGMNRYYHGFDMSTFSGRILYSNAKGNKNYYNITDMQASGSAITFSWLVDADAVQYMGKTAFVVYLYKTQGSELRQKFYSTLATLNVLEGMEVDSAVPVEKQTDIIERMKEEISAYAEEVKKSLPADYTAMTEQVSSLKEDIVESDLAINNITPNVLSTTKYDGREITSDVINEIYNNNGGTYELTQKLKPTDKVVPRMWFDDGTFLPTINGLALILKDDNNETVEQITFNGENHKSLENATKAFLKNYIATSLNEFKGKVIKGISLEYTVFSKKYYRPNEKYNPTITELEKSVNLLDAVIPNVLSDSEYNGKQFNHDVINTLYNSTIGIMINVQIKGKIIPNIIFNDGTNIGNVSGYVARIYSGNTLVEEVTLGNESTQDLSTATMIKFKTYRNDTASEYIGKNILCFSATISDYTQKYKPYELESKRLQKLESELTVENQIVCFGDSLTQGAGGNGISYPSVLKGLVGNNYNVINQGSGGENTIAILSRQGSVATYVNNITIPAKKTTVKLCQPNEYLDSNLGIKSLLTIAGDMTGINPCYINSVIGILSKVNDGNGVYYTFTRSKDGKEIVIDRPTRIFFYSTNRYNNSILCLFIGQNGGYSTEEELVEQIRNAIRHNCTDKYIILGLTTGSNTERASLEKTMQNAFGLHYLNTRKYLYMYGLSDANIKPTTQDENDIKNGIVPNSLRSDSVHLNDKGYTVLGNIVYKKGVELGYW